MTRNVQNWLSAYVEYTKHMEAPDLFHLWSAIGVIGGALRGKVWIDQQMFRWTPNFFIILVAPPGIISKSTTASIATSMLRQVPTIHMGPESVTWQALTDALQEAEIDFKSVGKLAALTVAASELGTFLDPKNRDLIDVLNHLWDGQPQPWKRRTRQSGETVIAYPWINLIGCTTPGWLEENVPSIMFKGGFMSRTVFVFQEKKRHLAAYLSDRMDGQESAFVHLKHMLIDDLKAISTIEGEYHLTPEAKQWGKDWYERHWTEKNPHGLSQDLFGPYFARKQTHVHKLAIVLAASRHSERYITPYELQQAESLITSLEPGMNKILGAIANSLDLRNITILCRYLLTEARTVSQQEAWRHCMKLMSREEFYIAERGATDAGLLEVLGEALNVVLRPNLREIRSLVDDTAVQTHSLEEYHSRAAADSAASVALSSQSSQPSPEVVEKEQLH